MPEALASSFPVVRYSLPKAYNPADFFLRIISPVSSPSLDAHNAKISGLIAAYEKSHYRIRRPLAVEDA
jgi:hypothetical protein